MAEPPWPVVLCVQVRPDIACFGKTLTGGYLPLAVTLTAEHVFKAFEGDSKVRHAETERWLLRGVCYLEREPSK